VRRKGLAPLVLFVLVTLGSVAYTLIADNSPLLGLDLQGGVSVVLQPEGEVASDTVDQAVDIIRNRVDALGVAEPEISRQGDTVLIQLPGAKNQDRALELVGQTAELRFRPVLAILPAQDAALPELPTTPTTPTTTPDGTTTTTSPPPEGTTGFLQPTTTTQAPTTTTAPAPSTTGTIPLPAQPTPDCPITALEPTDPPRGLNEDGITPRERDRPGRPVILPQNDDEGEIICRYHLGPTALTGSALEGADAIIDPQDPTGSRWVVSPRFKGGQDGIDAFNEIAAVCNAGDPVQCPTRKLAIVLDSEVISAPDIEEPSFERDQIIISGEFDESRAKDLALVLRYGALPVELEPQQVQTVSATLGRDSLEAGLVAGIVGLVLTALGMILYYRLLGVVAIASLTLEFLILWAIICWMGSSLGLALTLAGVTGIIVSIGISVDSNIVFYEHLKEDVHEGRSFRSTVERSFDSSFATIIKADVASLIGAGLLYWLSIGPVRGFALLLGISTIIDMIASWFFIRPAVLLLSRSPRLRDRESWFGMPRRRGATT
jgi:preprotein translocase subunit SecD